ncbi:hypothetical protein Halru_2169 [Halovivax ruber XH-70]|uniref:Uncharacterized protein n=1 Tax=Halovivax ruber (strain DSM 18193 / JCM 13892 / XH-70) TaxID=797302 RepID=L0IFK9_HALRX|nr:hypothetical protein [Halovivax ruber]AGB16757.1 hypothetical protein Halru_2169 [Halovivax ruber XH-70]
MGRYEYDAQRSGPACERCNVELTADHWVRLEALHQGTKSDRYEDGVRLVCVDCVAALGLLEFAGYGEPEPVEPPDADRVPADHAERNG